MIAELRQALVEAGASESTANAAAAAVAGAGETATKADLAELRGELREGQARLEARMLAYLVPVYALLAYLAVRIA